MRRIGQGSGEWWEGGYCFFLYVYMYRWIFKMMSILIKKIEKRCDLYVFLFFVSFLNEIKMSDL